MQGMGGGEQAPQVTSNPPANWQAQPLSSMRQASYLVKGENGAVADISIVFLEGGAGGVLDNVNRWLSQIGQPAIDEAKLKEISTQVSSPLGQVTLVDLQGLPPGGDAAKDGRIIAGIASTKDDQTVFFKMRGNAALAESQKEAFTQWIGTVRMAASNGNGAAAGSEAGAPGANPHAGMPMPSTGGTDPHAGVQMPTAGGTDPHAGMQMPGGMPSAGGANPHAGMAMGDMSQSMAAMAPMGGSANDADKPKWEVPQGWESVPASSMRVASFKVPGQNGDALDVSISNLSGNGGGDLLNVNRWRQQVGLSPITEEEMKKQVVPVKAKNAQVQTLDLSGGQRRMLVGWALVGGKTWFFKVTGSDALATSQKDNFTKFLQSVEFHQ
jgi:hypothetical protein